MRIVHRDWDRQLNRIARANVTQSRWWIKTEKITAILINSPLQKNNERFVASGFSQRGLRRSYCDYSLNTRRREERGRRWWDWCGILLIHLAVASEHLFSLCDLLRLRLARVFCSLEPGVLAHGRRLGLCLGAARSTGRCNPDRSVVRPDRCVALSNVIVPMLLAGDFNHWQLASVLRAPRTFLVSCVHRR